MARTPTLLDQFGTPVQRATLRQEVAAPTLTGVRSPVTGYPGDGLTPARLAQIMREADAGDPIRYLELAEVAEERDGHYTGVLGTRRRSVSQIEITVEPADDSAAAVEDAQLLRDYLRRDELRSEVFDILDAIGKGYSFTEIMWDSSGGQWMPDRLEYRDPRWFRFQRQNLTTPMILSETGQEQALPAFKFIYARMQAKSGLAMRSGIARVALWSYLFKKFTERDWAIFTQTYGQPLRLGKYPSGASEEDVSTLFRAVANIAGDCAAVIPQGMEIEFIEAKNVGASTDHYERRADWLDRQVSKLVLGQTATTDSVTGGLGSGKEHREVQEDIERADCSALAAILNRDLVRPFVDLNRGPQKRYPRIVIARPDEEDVKAWSDALAPWVAQGLPVPTDTIYAKFGLSAPAGAPKFLGGVQPQGAGGAQPGLSGDLNTVLTPSGEDQAQRAAAQSEAAPAPVLTPGVVPDLIADQLEVEAAPQMRAMLDQIEAMMGAAQSLPELREMLLSAFPDVDATELAGALAQGLLTANLAGRVMMEEEGEA